MSWTLRQIYDLPAEDLMDFGPFTCAFGKYHDVNGHKLLSVLTRPKETLLHPQVQTSGDGKASEGLTVSDRVLFVSSADVEGVESGETIRVNGKLYQILSVSRPIMEVIRLNLKGIDE